MKNDYISLTIMIVVSIIITYFLTMTIILRRNFTYNNNKLYQSILMGAWMGVAMILPMIALAEPANRKMLAQTFMPILIVLILTIVIFSWMIRQQIGIGEKQYILSMIEHHQMAIEMSNLVDPKVRDPRLRKLVDEIITAQNQEIDLMYTLL